MVQLRSIHLKIPEDARRRKTNAIEIDFSNMKFCSVRYAIRIICIFIRHKGSTEQTDSRAEDKHDTTMIKTNKNKIKK